MVLQGFSSAQYIGWISGILFLKSPKSPPTVFVTRSLYTIYISITYIIMSLMWIDLHTRHIHVLNQRHESSVEKFLSCSLFIGSSIFDFYFRLCFFLRAKIVARFLKSLEADMAKISTTNSILRIVPDYRSSWKIYKKLVLLVQIYHYFGAVVQALWVAAMVPDSTRFIGFIPGSVYPVFFFLFGAIPLASSFFVSFAFVVVTTIHIQWIFEDFCIFLDEQIEKFEGQIVNPMKRDLGEIYSIPTVMQGGKGVTNDQILSKFEHLKLLCSQYDKICGPLLMGLLVRAVFILISAANTILLYNGANNTEDKKMKLGLNVYHFVMEVSQLVLLQLGYMIHRRIADKKEELHRKVILMTNLGPKDKMKEVINVISEWKWSVSGGPGFFDVDRPLLSGVVSSLMTYVTILFQLNVADDNPGESGSDTTTNMPVFNITAPSF